MASCPGYGATKTFYFLSALRSHHHDLPYLILYPTILCISFSSFPYSCFVHPWMCSFCYLPCYSVTTQAWLPNLLTLLLTTRLSTVAVSLAPAPFHDLAFLALVKRLTFNAHTPIHISIRLLHRTKFYPTSRHRQSATGRLAVTLSFNRALQTHPVRLWAGSLTFEEGSNCDCYQTIYRESSYPSFPKTDLSKTEVLPRALEFCLSIQNMLALLMSRCLILQFETLPYSQEPPNSP